MTDALWPSIRAAAIERARHRCEACGIPNHAVGYREPRDGPFVPGCGNGPWDAAGEGLAWPSCAPLTYAEAREFADHANCCTNGRDDDGRRWIVVTLTVRPSDGRVLCGRCARRAAA